MRLCLAVPFAVMVICGTPCPNPPAVPGADPPTGFGPPEVLLDGSDCAVGYPAFADIDGDGKIDLVMGVADRKSHEGGRLLVYRNLGTNTRPMYAKPTWLDATVPTARIPDG